MPQDKQPDESTLEKLKRAARALLGTGLAGKAADELTKRERERQKQLDDI